MTRFYTSRPHIRRSQAALRAEILALFTLALCLLLGLSGCRTATEDAAGDESPTIVTTIHPFGILLRPIVGETGTVTTLLPAGISPHTYSPRPSDARKAAESRVLVFGHDHLDGWAADIRAPAHIELFGLVPDSLRLPFPPGVVEHQTRPAGQDPHFWTDPVTVKAILPSLIDALCARMPAHCSTFQTNGSASAARIDTLHNRLRQRMKPLQEKSVLLATPFFQYFLHRYDLALAGVIEPIPGAEIAPQTLQDIIQTTRHQEIAAILASQQHSDRMAQTVSEATGIPLIRMDPIGDEQGASTYEALVLNNAHWLLKALN